MQDLNDKVRSLEERLASPDPLAILKALAALPEA